MRMHHACACTCTCTHHATSHTCNMFTCRLPYASSYNVGSTSCAILGSATMISVPFVRLSYAAKANDNTQNMPPISSTSRPTTLPYKANSYGCSTRKWRQRKSETGALKLWLQDYFPFGHETAKPLNVARNPMKNLRWMTTSLKMSFLNNLVV
jgi:hypothetical protein